MVLHVHECACASALWIRDRTRLQGFCRSAPDPGSEGGGPRPETGIPQLGRDLYEPHLPGGSVRDHRREHGAERRAVPPRHALRKAGPRTGAGDRSLPSLGEAGDALEPERHDRRLVPGRTRDRRSHDGEARPLRLCERAAAVQERDARRSGRRLHRARIRGRCPRDAGPGAGGGARGGSGVGRERGRVSGDAQLPRVGHDLRAGARPHLFPRQPQLERGVGRLRPSTGTPISPRS